MKGLDSFKNFEEECVGLVIKYTLDNKPIPSTCFIDDRALKQASQDYIHFLKFYIRYEGQIDNKYMKEGSKLLDEKESIAPTLIKKIFEDLSQKNLNWFRENHKFHLEMEPESNCFKIMPGFVEVQV